MKHQTIKRTKIVQPCLCDVGRSIPTRAFAKITYDETKGVLSIVGVIGPTANGDARGSCGQCIDEIRHGTPAKPWTKNMLDRFCDIWKEWHLNDMRPYCVHQKDMGWDKLAAKNVTLYHYTLTLETLHQQEAAKTAALDALKKGVPFTPTPQQTLLANLRYSITRPQPLTGAEASYYKPAERKPYSPGPTSTERLGNLYANQHPDGLLGKPCPVCGYQYGGEWQKEDVPQDVLDWLFNLPDTDVEPAWI